MSIEEAKERGLSVIPAWAPVATVIVTALVSLGINWATVSVNNQWQDDRLMRLEKRVEKLEDISRSLYRIEGALGIKERP